MRPSGGSPNSPTEAVNESFPKFNSVTQQSDVGVSRTSPIDQLSKVPPQFIPAEQQIRNEANLERNTEEKGKDVESETNTKSIYSLFPDPPDPLEHFDKWFPDSPVEEKHEEQKQKAFVEKSLPQPPYHVFDRSKKLQLVILVSFAGILSPLSTSIYLPALMAIASVREGK